MQKKRSGITLVRWTIHARVAVQLPGRMRNQGRAVMMGGLKSVEPGHKIIGLGPCGSVFKIPGTGLALKKGKDIKTLWDDYCLANVVHYAITDTRELIQTGFPKNTIPRTRYCTFFRLPISPDYWQTNVSKFQASHREPSALFQVNRILTLPQLVRDALITQYFDEENSEEAKIDNLVSSVRPYSPQDCGPIRTSTMVAAGRPAATWNRPSQVEEEQAGQKLYQTKNSYSH